MIYQIEEGRGRSIRKILPQYSFYFYKKVEKGGVGEGVGGAKDPPPLSKSGSDAFDIGRIFLIICNVLAPFPKCGMTVYENLLHVSCETLNSNLLNMYMLNTRIHSNADIKHRECPTEARPRPLSI